MPRNRDDDIRLGGDIPRVVRRDQNVDKILARMRVEIFRKEKEKFKSEKKLKSKTFARKEKVSYVEMEFSSEEFDVEFSEVDLAELKKKITSVDKANDMKYKSEKKYSFDISKSDQIFDFFLSDERTYSRGIPSPAKREKDNAVAIVPIDGKEKDDDLDEQYLDEGDEKIVGIISIIPTEYLGEYEGNLSEDYDVEDEEVFAFVREDEELGCFKKPTEKQKSHL
ncbi:hypothetical protein Ahy_B10g105429 [Arachis hypogaea]|uniref:Uncharacterized protein n=1 Tax=Arachis hypogaea TaxID=3818 RepID=A0A444X811_ARAHY|nr:hypothetical protein Ahy_B10g105429 [Arachis hypogaea]